MRKLRSVFMAALAARFLPRTAQAGLAGIDASAPLHYRPLEGRSLRDMALRRMHHGEGYFINPMGLPRNRRFWQVLTWKLFRRNGYADDLLDQPFTPVSIDWTPVMAHPGVSVTLIRHASLLIRDLNRTLLIDPVFGDIFWFIRNHAPIASPLAALPRPDHVLITHGHYDHLDTASLAKLDRGTHIISPLGYDDTFDALGMHHRTRLDWYQRFRDGALQVTLLPANHWTMRNPLVGPNRSLWGGYLIRTAGGPVIYVAGDSAYFDGFEQLADDADIDLAIFNLGAYAPRWFMASSHMNPEETVRAFVDLSARRLMIAHWGTFRLGDEPIHYPPRDLEAVLETKGLLSRHIRLGLGETHYF